MYQKKRQRDHIVYMAITADKYELPICVKKTIAEIAHWLGVNKKSASGYISKGLTIKKHACKVIKVRI